MAGPAKTTKVRKGARKPEKPADPAVRAEVMLDRLDAVVRELEGGDLPLEQALARFEEGVKLVREGEELLASVEQRIEILLGDDRIVPFADERDYDDEDDDPEAGEA